MRLTLDMPGGVPGAFVADIVEAIKHGPDHDQDHVSVRAEWDVRPDLSMSCPGVDVRAHYFGPDGRRLASEVLNLPRWSWIK